LCCAPERAQNKEQSERFGCTFFRERRQLVWSTAPPDTMLLTRSTKQKVAASCGAILGFVLLREVTTLDSRRASAADAVVRESVAPPKPGARLRFSATAYCKGTTTASGAAVKTGIVAADPDLLPQGSVIQIESLGQRYNGIYTVMDTGPAVKGRLLDIYMWSCNEALKFGRKSTTLNVLRLGWNPRATTVAAAPAGRSGDRQKVARASMTSATGLAAAISPSAVASRARTAIVPPRN
jgi:3D (Asp-Asp-Asp) domain-containing protein